MNIHKAYQPQGCDHCHYTGYKGRVAIYEVIGIDDDIRSIIKQGKGDIKEHLKKKEITSLIDNTLELLKEGRTSLEEVYPILLTF